MKDFVYYTDGNDYVQGSIVSPQGTIVRTVGDRVLIELPDGTRVWYRKDEVSDE